jgi:predicted transcriptional regulator
MSRGPGRPTLPADDKLSNRLTVRLTEDERRQLERVAGAVELRSSNWARRAITEALARVRLDRD